MRSKTYHYSAFGLCLQSELVLPELVATDVAPDVVVHLSEVDAEVPGTASNASLISMETEVGKYFIIGDSEILIQPLPGVEEAVIRLFLLGPVMAVLLRRRGLLALHASAIAIDDSVVAFLGDSGWGKSTLAGAFLARGYQLVTDDILAIQIKQGRPTALPSFPQAKLWPEAAAALGFAEKSRELYDHSAKLGYRLNGEFSQSALPLRCLYLLGGTGDQHQIGPCQAKAAFVSLVRHSRAMSLPNRPDLDRLHFRQCARLVKGTPIRLLKPRRSLSELPNLVNLIEKDLAIEQS